MPKDKIISGDISGNWTRRYGPSSEIDSEDSVDVERFSLKLKDEDKKLEEQAAKAELNRMRMYRKRKAW